MNINFIILSLFITATLNSLSAQVTNDLVKDNLNGKIKEITYSKYEIKMKFGEIEKLSDPKLDYKVVYNNKGNYKSTVFYNIEEKPNFNIQYIYDTNDNLVTQNNILDDKISIKHNYIYNEKGQLIKQKYTSFADNPFSETYEYHYDNDGNNTETIHYNKMGKKIRKYNSIYNNEGKVITDLPYVSFEGKTDINNGMKQYDYDDNGNKIQTKRFDNQRNLSQTTNFSYDSNNNIIEYNKFDKNGTLIENVKVQYEYDNKNNWVKQTKIVDNTKGDVYERVIKYN